MMTMRRFLMHIVKGALLVIVEEAIEEAKRQYPDVGSKLTDKQKWDTLCETIGGIIYEYINRQVK